MNRVMMAASITILMGTGYACTKEDNPTTASTGTQLTAILSGQPGSTSATTTTATGAFQGQLDQSSTVLSYTVTYSGITPTAISLDPSTTSTSIASGTSPYSNSILLAGAFSTTTNPGSSTSTTPGSGTSTSPGSGTGTSPGSGTATSPGSGTAVALTSPLSGTVSLSQTQANYLTGGQYQLTIRSVTHPNGELVGTIRIR